jgi:hypothetical protein
MGLQKGSQKLRKYSPIIRGTVTQKKESTSTQNRWDSRNFLMLLDGSASVSNFLLDFVQRKYDWSSRSYNG